MPTDSPSPKQAPGVSCFPTSVVERLGSYVYVLRDPRDGAFFYVGKGTGNRVFVHVGEALECPDETDKLDRIRAIHEAGREVGYEIVRHGLTEDQAFEVESALIDWIGVDELHNAVVGHHVDRRGRMSVGEIIAVYRAEPVTLTVPCILITVNRRFERGIHSERLYEATRGDWVVGARRTKARYAIAVFRGLARAVYQITAWEPVQTGNPSRRRQERWRFTGVVASDLQHLIGGDVTGYLGKTPQNPIRYVNC